MHRKSLLGLLVASLFLVHCGAPHWETILDGYDKGKKTFKVEWRLFNVNLENGEKGHRYEAVTHFAIGDKATRKLERTAFLAKDYTLVSSESVFQSDDKISKTKTTYQNGELRIERTDAEGKTENQTIAQDGPVYVELPAPLYRADLTKVDQEKVYPVIDESEGRVVPVKVVFKGGKRIYIENEELFANHYQIQSITAPEEFDDYYLDPKTGKIIKITFGMIEFIPAK